MRKTIACLGAILAASALSSAAWSAEPKSVLRFGLGYALPSGDLTESASFGGVDLGDGTLLSFDGSLTLEPQDAPALVVEYEYRLSERIGMGAGLFRASPGVDGRALGTYWINDQTTGDLIETGSLDATEKVGDLSILPLTFAANIHLSPKSKADFYLAPVVGYVSYGDFDLSGEKVAVKSAFAWGATAGVDLPLGKGRWLISGALRYLASEAEIDEPGAGGEAIDLTLLVVQVGAGYRF